MALSAFADKSKQPTPADLAAVLGKSYTYWKDLQARISSLIGTPVVEWGFTSKSTGWGLRIKKDKRVIIYMTPSQGYFLASFALGEKAVQVAHDSKLPSAILKTIDESPKYAEGRGIRIAVKTSTDVRNIERLAMIKLAN